MIEGYFRRLYARTMAEAYGLAGREAAVALRDGGRVLDCGAGSGHGFERLATLASLEPARYAGIEWDAEGVAAARGRGLDVRAGDLNRPLPYADGSFQCVNALSVLEHLLHPCAFLREAHRVLQPGGRLVLLTPNISTYFTVALLLAGRMPSSGPHPDSEALMASEQPFRVNTLGVDPDVEADTPVHRHLVVFSFRVLKRYLQMLGFGDVRGRGFGLYPFPAFAQPLLERLDPWHCHQMVFVARR